MTELLEKLGIDKWLLLAQAVNFLVLLWVLRKFVYLPLLKAMKDRQGRIEEGFTKAEEADKRLLNAQEMVKDRLKAAEEESLGILRATEGKAKKQEAKLLEEAHKKEAQVLANADLVAKAKEEQASLKFQEEAKVLLRSALSKAVAVHPEKIDEALIESAFKEIKSSI